MFSHICDSLHINKINRIKFSQTLSDFIVMISTGKYDFNLVALAPQLPEFLELCLYPFTQISASSNSDFLTFIANIIDFLTKLFSHHPNFITITSQKFDFDLVLGIIPQLSNETFTVQLLNFIANVSVTPQIIIKHPQACMDSLIKLYQNSINNGTVIFILTSLIRNSHSFEAFLKSSSYLSQFQAIIVENVSSDDHYCVISSLSSMISIFPGTFDGNTGKLAAQHALSVSNESFILLHSALWILKDLALNQIITSSDLPQLVEFAIRCKPMKSYYIFETLNYIVANSSKSLFPLKGENSLFDITSLVNLLLSQGNGFLSLSIVKFLQQYFESNDEIFNELSGISEIISKAINVISSPITFSDTDYLDCILVFLRFLAATPSAFQEARPTLLTYEEQLFIGLQRSIEMNNGFASINLYLFISQCAQNIKTWERRLQLIITDSQFGALLAHVLEHSTDRHSILDAVQTIVQISNSRHLSQFTSSSILFDSVISGFVVINAHSNKILKENQEQNFSIIKKQKDEISSLNGQIETNELEIHSLNEQLNACKSSSSDLEKQYNTALSNITEKQSEIDLLKKENNERQKEIEMLKAQLNKANQVIDSLNMKIEIQSHDNNNLNQQIQKYCVIEKTKENIEKEKLKLECDKETSTKELQSLQSKIDNFKSLNDSLKGKVHDLKTTNEALKIRMDDLSHDKDKITLNLKQCQESLSEKVQMIEIYQRKYKDLKAKLKQLKQAYDAIRIREVELTNSNDILSQSEKDLKKKLNDLEKQKKEWELLLEFMHRITDDDRPPTEQIANLIDEI